MALEVDNSGSSKACHRLKRSLIAPGAVQRRATALSRASQAFQARVRRHPPTAPGFCVALGLPEMT